MNRHFSDSLPKEEPVEEGTGDDESPELQWDVPPLTDGDYREGPLDESRPTKKIVAPPPVPWASQDMGEVPPNLVRAVQELRELGEKVSLDGAAEALQPIYGEGHTKWECCLDIMEAMGFLHVVKPAKRNSLTKTQSVVCS
jgi:hypothetical protein